MTPGAIALLIVVIDRLRDIDARHILDDTAGANESKDINTKPSSRAQWLFTADIFGEDKYP